MIPEAPARLILFTRYPEPGRVKTRLIPRLGSEEAAALQRRLAERQAAWMRLLRGERTDVALEVRFDGADAGRFREWLGEDFRYAPQGEGDLGERLRRALEEALAEGAPGALLLGSDVLGLDPQALSRAVDALADADVVLVPVRDGGYGLIGLKAPHPELFQRMPWSTANVFEETRRRAESQGLRVRALETLADVDRPEDLALLDAGLLEERRPRLSVVAPTRNEETSISLFLYHLRERAQRLDDLELIVADGGSTDLTRQKVLEEWPGVRLVAAPPGRGGQMDAGAALARGRYLLFLHADAVPPQDYDAHVEYAFQAHPTLSLGAFDFAINSPRRAYRFVETLTRWRSHKLKTPYGDQGLFLRNETFHELGGFQGMPILEDLDLVRRARRTGLVLTLQHRCATSARRWERLGVWGTFWTNQRMLWGYFRGESPERLASRYCAGTEERP